MERSSNINEVIRTGLNSLFFFDRNILHAQKHSQAKISQQKKKVNTKQQR